MDENKNYENENIEETTETSAEETVETTETPAEETVETAETPADETVETAETSAEETVETTETPADETTETAEPTEEPVYEMTEPEEIRKGSKAGVIIAVVVAIVVIAAAVLTQNDKFYGMFTANKYNRGFVNVSGMTIKDVLNGGELADFLTQYGLPEDMPESTYIEAAEYRIPIGKMAELNGIELDALKSALNLPDTVTAETPLGEAEDEMTLADRIGADNMDKFKEYYGFGDEVTAEMKWKDIKDKVNKIDKQKNDEAKKQKEDAAASTDSADTDNSANATAE